MTELSYTAWDDNRYQWPPPEGWYQASDGKWWPEGYGPVGSQPATEDEPDQDSNDVSDDPGEAQSDDFTEAEVEAAEVGHEAEGDGGGYIDDSGDLDELDEVDEPVASAMAAADDLATDTVGEVEVDADHVEQVDQYEPLGHIEHEVEAGAEAADTHVSELASGLADSGEPSVSATTAGMAASGLAARTEGSSHGLAGWAQSGASDVRSGVDVTRQYDYAGGGDVDGPDLLEPYDDGVESDTENGAESSDVATDTAAHAFDAPTVEISDLQPAAEPVDATLNQLDDLKRQVEEQSFTSSPVSDDDGATLVPGVGGIDPTETLDIDPNDLSLESNPYYGGSDDTAVMADAPTVDIAESNGVDNWDGGAVESLDHGGNDGYDEQAETSVADSFGFDSAPAPVNDQPIPIGDVFADQQSDYSGTSVLTPMSSPPPKGGMGRLMLYGIIALVALALAALAGYLVFQFQGDDDTAAESDDNSASASAVGDTGGQPGSFTNPHELNGGVRLTVPVDGTTEVWMLQVREPATTTDLGDDQVEVTSRIRVRNDSTGGDLSASGLRFMLVSADGADATEAAAGCSAGDDLNLVSPIGPGKDIEGNVCWTVPAGQAGDALLGIESVHAGGRVHVQLN